MDIRTADEIIAFLDGYNRHFQELILFLVQKESRILGDDLIWLSDSLVREQELIMRGDSIENKRNALFERLDIKNITSNVLIDICPEERKALMKMQCKSLENSVLRIKKLNDNALDLVDRKLTVLATTIGAPEFSHVDTYTGSCEKVKRSVGEIIGSV